MMAQASDLAPSLNESLPNLPNTIYPYLQQAPNHPSLAGIVSFFNASPSHATYPPPLSSTTSHTLLYPSSFNPPHLDHLATILYLFNHRQRRNITALFLFSDPDAIIITKNKKWGLVILPLDLRNTIFTQVPELKGLIDEGWLHLLVGSMESHIALLRRVTDMISDTRWKVRLVGFLRGDKLSKDSRPDESPGELMAWGPQDEFLIIDAIFILWGRGKTRGICLVVAGGRDETVVMMVNILLFPSPETYQGEAVDIQCSREGSWSRVGLQSPNRSRRTSDLLPCFWEQCFK
jgi:hypothetical protein